MTTIPVSPRPLDALTSLRFFAAAMVMLFHFWAIFLGDVAPPPPVALGYTGVSFFFVLSGFILTYTYERDGRFDGGGFERYAMHRLARIGPVYLMAIGLFLPFLTSSFLKEGATFRLVAAAVTTPFALQAWVPGSTTVINFPGWSISTEAFFYLCFPLLVAPAFRRPERAIASAFGWMIVVWLVGSLVWVRVAGDLDLITAPIGSFDAPTERVADALRYLPPLRIGEFALGMALCALWRKGRLPSDPRRLLLAAAGGAAAVALLADRLPGPVLFDGISVIVWAPLVVWGANLRSGLLVRPFAVLLGRISFALYLLHAIVLYYALAIDKHLLGGWLQAHGAATVALLSAVSLAAAWVAFHLVEEPMRRRMTRPRSPEPTEAPAVPIGVGAAGSTDRGDDARLRAWRLPAACDFGSSLADEAGLVSSPSREETIP
ncbi:MAG: acyltransferase [Hyphomicrobiales bacterium]|nr:acyltransferase [Hyphomicrobiales bacterium]